MWKKSSGIATVLFFGLLRLGFSQPYGHEWIDYHQPYFRIGIAENGIYRITDLELQAAGVPVSTVSASRIQLFRRGKEIALIRKQHDNGTLKYLEFYAEKNDGRGDSALYVSPEAQPHLYYNLFTDTATYFLTVKAAGTGEGKTMDISTQQDFSGLTAKPYHLNESLRLQTNVYSGGYAFGPQSALTSGQYDHAEGWTGTFFQKNESQSFSFNLANRDTSGPNPSVEIHLIGGNTLEHLVEISAGPTSTSQREIGTASFSDRYNFRFTGELEWSDISPEGDCVVKVTALGAAGQAERVSVAFVKLTYPQEFVQGPDENNYYYLRQTSASRAYIRISTPDAPGTRVFDVTDPHAPVEIFGNTSEPGVLRLLAHDLTTARRLYAMTRTKVVPSIQEVQFTQLSPAAVNYLIVSHPALRQPAGDGSDPVAAYEAYRESAAGGGFNVLTVNIDDLFNQFNYGDASPLAIKNFVRYLYAQGSPEYMLLIGKGVSVNEEYYRKDPATSGLVNFIPTYGYPGSDLLFTTGLQTGDPVPAIPVGRLNAFDPDDVKAYLDKVKETEALGYNDLWRKRQILLSGGQNTAEQNLFYRYVSTFLSFAESDFLGGKGLIRRKTSEEAFQNINIAREINEGAGMVTFFGHSGSAVTDVEIGVVSSDKDGYSNKGKYPVFLVNGCNAGEIFGTTYTFGEDWINTADRGAIAFIANSDFALSNKLRQYSNFFYRVAFMEEAFFGKSLGKIIKEVNGRMIASNGSDENLAQVYQTLLQGDPAIKVFGAEAPDYSILSEELSATPLSGDRILASQDAFMLNLPVRNFGRTVKDSLSVVVERTLPEGDIVHYYRKFASVRYQDTIRFMIENDPGEKMDGTNTFVVRLDPADSIYELNKLNNAASLELFIPKGNTINLFPPDLGVRSDPQVKFVWQSADPLGNVRDFSFELDTVPGFSSLFRQSMVVRGELLLSHEADLGTLPDSTTVFWRTKFANPGPTEDTAWVSSSFSLINETESGWGQLAIDQIRGNIQENVSYHTSSGNWEFIERFIPFRIVTHGIDHVSGTYEDLLVMIDEVNFLSTNNLPDPVCRVNTLNAVVFDKETAQPYRPLGNTGNDVFNDLVCGRLPQMIHNLTEDYILGPDRYLEQLIDRMQDGDAILLFSFDSVAYSNWDDGVKTALNEVGILTSTINSLTDGQPVIFWGIKGSSPGDAVEITGDGSFTPAKSQQIALADTVTGKPSEGKLISRRIGPAKSWGSLVYRVDAEATDSYGVTVQGLKKDGSEEEVIADAAMEGTDLTSLDANVYPYLRLNFHFSDTGNLTPPQLASWVVDYTLPPEGLLVAGNRESVKLDEGNPFTCTFDFVNISREDFTDSLQVAADLFNVSSGHHDQQAFKVAGPPAGDTTSFTIARPTLNKVGTNNLAVNLQAAENELTRVNNYLSMPGLLEVAADKTNPVLDVTFDGSYILDGDIVSPDPVILIRLKDENQYLYKDDTTGIEISLKRPCEGCQSERVSFTDPKVSYQTASEDQDFEITYRPGPLEDGIYTLGVQATDASGNTSGAAEYAIRFEVINEASVTHFYPYPNPFSTQTRFVFTLTGSQLPDEIKIQIMTVSGRVVREIIQDEIGPLKIGNNITTYAWDGRDEYGDLLANGVYFYKVFIRQNGERIKHRNTSADGAFKHGFGKIYILR